MDAAIYYLRIHVLKCEVAQFHLRFGRNIREISRCRWAPFDDGGTPSRECIWSVMVVDSASLIRINNVIQTEAQEDIPWPSGTPCVRILLIGAIEPAILSSQRDAHLDGEDRIIAMATPR